MARLHVKLRNGHMVSGAAAFAAIWQRVPAWRWVAHVARIPGILTLLEAGYRLFLPIRPWISRCLGDFSELIQDAIEPSKQLAADTCRGI